MNERIIIDPNRKQFHFLSKSVTENDIELFFGPDITENDVFVRIEDHWIMAHLLHRIGIFPSVSQARKNGWNKEIPSGFRWFTTGKKANKQTFFILNIREEKK